MDLLIFGFVGFGSFPLCHSSCYLLGRFIGLVLLVSLRASKFRIFTIHLIPPHIHIPLSTLHCRFITLVFLSPPSKRPLRPHRSNLERTRMTFFFYLVSITFSIVFMDCISVLDFEGYVSSYLLSLTSITCSTTSLPVHPIATYLMGKINESVQFLYP